MVNALEDKLFEKIEKKRKGAKIKIGLVDAMIIVSGANSEKKFIREKKKIRLFNEQFLQEFGWTYKLPQNQKQRAKTISDYMKERLIHIKSSSGFTLNEGGFLLDNPFSHIGKKQEIFASWLSLCALQKLKNVGILSSIDEIHGYFHDGENEFIFDPKHGWTELEERPGLVQYSKSSIVSEILTQRAKGRYDAGRFGEALDDCEKALKISPNYVKTLYYAMLSKKGLGGEANFKGAVKYFERLVGFEEYAQAYAKIFGVYAMLGNSEKANDCFGRIQTLGNRELKAEIKKEIKNIKRGKLQFKI